jgi:hypothetical protein
MFAIANQRVWQYVVVGASVLTGTSCSRERDSEIAPVAHLKRGDRVVVEPTAADFFEARLLEVDGTKLRLQRSDSGDVLTVGGADVYRLGERSSRLTASSFAVCELEPHRWLSCQIERVTLNGFVVVDTNGQKCELDRAKVLEPTGLSEMNIRRRFEDVVRRRAFSASISSAGQPRKVAGWTPAPHRLVLAERDGHWYGAKVVETGDSLVVLVWDGQKDSAELPKAVVMPQPPACGLPQRGDRALRRPTGHGAPWEAVVVVGLDGADVTIENIERVRFIVDVGDLCPLGESKTVVESSAASSSS